MREAGVTLRGDMGIDSSALVHPGARLASGVSVGPFAVIEDDVDVGAGCDIRAHAVVKRYTRLGAGNAVTDEPVESSLQLLRRSAVHRVVHVLRRIDREPRKSRLCGNIHVSRRFQVVGVGTESPVVADLEDAEDRLVHDLLRGSLCAGA